MIGACPVQGVTGENTSDSGMLKKVAMCAGSC